MGTAAWKRTCAGIGLVLAVTAGAAPAAAQEAIIGYVKNVSGLATVTHDDLTYAAVPGMAVHERDTLQTFWNGEMGVTFKDDTRISLGHFSRVTIPQFTFVPAQRQYGFVIRLLLGTMQYISGLTAKLAPESVKIETPTSTIGVRGTRFLARAAM